MLLGKLSGLHGLAPLILRLVLGVIFIAHGYPKLFGGGMEKFVGTVTTKVGMPPFMAYVAALSEFGGGVLLLLGLFTRWAALLHRRSHGRSHSHHPLEPGACEGL